MTTLKDGSTVTTNPRAAGLSPDRLETLDHFCSRYIDAGKIPGALTLIYRRGEIAHFSALGFADGGREKPVREDTIFRIYSMTKPITSVAFMHLVEQGLVSLDDPVHRFIPQWKDLGVYVGGFMPKRSRPKRPERPMLMHRPACATPPGLTYGFQTTTNVDAAYRKLGIGELERHGTLEEMVAEARRRAARLSRRARPGTTRSPRTSSATSSASSPACRSTSTCARASSSRWAWPTPTSTSTRVRARASPPATPLPPAGGMVADGRRRASPTSGRRRCSPAAAGSSRTPPTTCASAGCC